MTKNLKDERSPTGISADDLKRVIGEAVRQKQLASEYSGLHGKVVSNAVEQYGIEKNAFTLTRRMYEMEEGRRMAIVRSTIDYWHKIGFFDQVDAFDDVIDLMRRIVSENDRGASRASGADADVREVLAR